MGIPIETVVHELRRHCLSFPGAVEEIPWGHLGWKVKGKLFAIGSEDSNRLTVKSTLDKQAALIQLPCIQTASHVGRYGWVTLTIEDEAMLDLAKSLIEESYASVAKKK
jgi:predicted DNA-binding protein (MmcQ/YjbR family)